MIRELIAVTAATTLLAGCGKPLVEEAEAQTPGGAQVIGFNMAGVTPILLLRRSSGALVLCSLRMSPESWTCSNLPPLNL